MEVNRYLKLIEHFNDYGQEKGVFIFDGHGASDGKSISYSETGSVTVNQIAQALINAHNNGVNLETLTLVFASCHSYKFADNIINELINNGITKFPQVITDAGKETVYGYTKSIDIDGISIGVSNLFYSLLKFLDSKMEVIASGLNLPESRALEQAGMAYYHTINTANKMNNQINSVSPKYWGAFKELALGTLNYGWNQMSNEILYWTGN